MPKKLIYSYLNDDELLRISNKIRDVEKTTAGELVVSIKARRKLFEKSKSLKVLAEQEFIDAGIAKTVGSTGVLIFLVLTSKEFYILADKKINEKVDQAVWNNIATEMGNHFIDGNFCKGILRGIEECGKILSDHFPILPDDVNELPNNIRLRK